MEILGVGPLELLFILLIIFLVMGPEDMQKTARTLGRWMRRVTASEAWRDITHTSQMLRDLPNKFAREAGLDASILPPNTVFYEQGEVKHFEADFEHYADSVVKPADNAESNPTALAEAKDIHAPVKPDAAREEL